MREYPIPPLAGDPNSRSGSIFEFDEEENYIDIGDLSKNSFVNLRKWVVYKINNYGFFYRRDFKEGVLDKDKIPRRLVLHTSLSFGEGFKSEIQEKTNGYLHNIGFDYAKITFQMQGIDFLSLHIYPTNWMLKELIEMYKTSNIKTASSLSDLLKDDNSRNQL